MAADPEAIDVDALTPQEFIALVQSSSDNEIRASFRAAGTSKGLDRIFAMMSEYYRPDRAGDVDAQVQWRITDDGEDFLYVIHFLPDVCEARPGTVDRPTTTVSTDLARFARIVAGQANAVKLLMTRKLHASGDVMFARKIPGFFDIPSA